MKPSHLNTAIDLCYSELDQPGGLTEMLKHLVECFDLIAADIVTEDRWGSSIETHATIGFDPVFQNNYDDEYLGNNPWFKALTALSDKSFHHVEGQCPEINSSSYYNEWARPQGLNHSLGAVLEHNQTRQSWIGLAGSSDRQFEEIQAYLNKLLPHVRRVLNTKHRLSKSARNGCATAVLNNLSLPLIILDAAGRKVLANDEANLLFKDANLIGYGHNGVPHLRVPSAEQQFSQALSLALQGSPCGRDEISPPLVVMSAKGDHYSLHFVQLPTEGSCQENAKLALAIVPPEQGPVDTSAFAKSYGLTKSESRVAAWLASGRTLTDLADQDNVSVSTLRWHLKNAESKTGTTRIEQLVSMILRAQLPFSV